MEKRRRITEEDLLITEVLIAGSYGRLKQSVIRAPSRAFSSLGRTAREHPYATAGAAVVAGIVLYGIIRKMTTHTPVQGSPGRPQIPVQKATSHSDLLHEMLPLIIPLAAPYVMGYIQKYLGKIHSEDRY
jgi:hypothetical protein